MSVTAGAGVEVVAIDTPTLGDRSYLVHDGTVALVVDPQRDIDRVLGLAAARGVRITHVFETHLRTSPTWPRSAATAR
jgi:hydroxyacylglutathione hydrolase